MNTPHEHEIFVSWDKVCCTCGITKRFQTHIYARKFAEKHARSVESYIIRPFKPN